MKILTKFTMLLLAFNSNVWAQSNDQQWWFNVELIVFKRNLLPDNSENFEQEQFTLDLSNSNNLLYLEALKQASKFNSLENALPICDIKNVRNGELGITYDFIYSPNTRKNIVVDNNGGDDIQKNDNGNLHPNIESNQLKMDSLLTPLFLSIPNDNDEIANIIDSLSDKNDINDLAEQNSSKNHFDAATSMIEELSYKMEQNTEPSFLLSCLQNQPQAVALIDTALSSIGPELFSESDQFTGNSQVISVQETAMNDYAEKIFYQRDIQPLLHTAWRQEVKFGIENAEFFTVRAGNSLKTSKKLDYNTWHKGYQANTTVKPLTEESAFFDDLQSAIENNDAVDWLSNTEDTSENTEYVEQTEYELEGHLKVYLDYVNQVPYLHIDNEFNHYKLTIDDDGSGYLETFPMKQRRRIVSKQVHYFDHPSFGLIVRLERFTPPKED